MWYKAINVRVIRSSLRILLVNIDARFGHDVHNHGTTVTVNTFARDTVEHYIFCTSCTAMVLPMLYYARLPGRLLPIVYIQYLACCLLFILRSSK